MKKLDYLYFNIYNHCYQRSNYPGELAARLQAMYSLSLSVGGWILLLQTVYLRLYKNVWFTSRPVAMSFAISVYLLVAVLFYRIFIVNERDQKIYSKFEPSWKENPNKKRDLVVSAFMVVVPYILMFSFSTFFPRQH